VTGSTLVRPAALRGGRFAGFLSAFLLSCFPAFLLSCFPAFLLSCFPAFLLSCVSAFRASRSA
jgi:hypothetical protein